jgi:adenylate kinase
MPENRKQDRRLWLNGPSTPCNSIPEENQAPWRLVLLGAPGVGKGTQAELLNHQLRACHLSTGDVFRTAGTKQDCDQSPAIREAVAHMRRGELVPDTTVWAIIRERRACLNCGGGFVLDGFPRTLNQAESLQKLMEEEGIALDAVVSYELPFDAIVARLGGRRTCAKCKAVYHVTERPPKIASKCDKCGGELLQREDDRPESVAVRLETYNRSTAPLIDFYRKLGQLVQIPAHGSPDQICARTITELERRRVSQLSYVSMHEF